MVRGVTDPVDGVGSRRVLTLADHARLQRHLVLIPAYLWLLYGWWDILFHLPLGLPGSRVQPARDFIQFYFQGVIAAQGNAHSLYDIGYWQTLFTTAPEGLTQVWYPPVYGPQIAVLFAPFAHLSYMAALCVWISISFAIYLACSFAVARGCPRLRDNAGTVALLLLANPALYYTLRFAQISALGLLSVTAAFFGLRANRPFVAGLAIGSLIYKPQSGLAAAVIFVANREWRVVLGAICGAILQLSIGWLFLGSSVVAAYGRSLLRMAPGYAPGLQPFKFHMHSWSSFFDLFALPGWVASLAYAVAAVITLVVAARCWRAAGPLTLRYAVFLISTVLVNPHVYVYDLLLLTPALLLLWEWALEHEGRTLGDVLADLPPRWVTRRSFRTLEWLLYFCYMSPLFAIVALMTRVQLSVPALTLLGLVPTTFLLWRTRGSVSSKTHLVSSDDLAH